MKTKRGNLSIEIGYDNQPVVMFHPINDTVWMNRNELRDLFGIYRRTIDKYLNDILKSKTLNVEEVCHYHRYVKGDKICYEITEVNLEVIITLIFQIDSPQATILRKWFVEQFLKSNQLNSLVVEIEQNCSWN